MSQQPPFGPPPPTGPPPAMPPPPGGAPYPGGQVPMGAPYDAIEAIQYGWRKFTENVAPFLIVAGVYLLLYYVNLVVTQVLLPGGVFDDPYTMSTGEAAVGGLVRIVLGVLMPLVWWVMAFALVRGAADVVDTGHTDLGQMFTRIPWLQAFLLAVLVLLVTTVGTFLCFIPGLIAAFLLVFSPVGVVEGQEALDAMRSSFELAKNRVGDVLIYVLLAIVVGFVVVLCTCALGLLVVAPVSTIGLVYTWRVLQGRPVAA